MVDRQKTESNSRGGDIKLEISFEWSSTGVGVGTQIILIFINDLTYQVKYLNLQMT